MSRSTSTARADAMPAQNQHADLDPRRWRALPAILIGSFLSFLDFFIVTIALPSIRAELDASPAQLQFVVAAYGIGFAVTLITGGRLGDIYGRRRIFLLGMGGFTLASALCGLAPSAATLIAARVLQAVFAATVTPQVLAIIRVGFSVTERPVAVGLYGASMGLASITAQLLGGALVSLNLFGWSWRLAFLINIPIGLAAILLTWRLVRESRNPADATLDIPGVGLVSVALFLLIFPTIEGREAGWPVWSFAMLAATVPVLAAFVLQQRHVSRLGRTPLVALHLLRITALRRGLVTSIAFFSTAGVFFVVLTVYFQAGHGYSAFKAGLMFLPFAIAFSLSSAVSGPLANRIGPLTINLGAALMAAGLVGVVAAAGPAGVHEPVLVAAMAIYGFGQGFAQPALINAVIGSAGVTGEDAGSAAGLFLTTAQSAIALGVAVIGDVFFAWLTPMPTASSYRGALIAALSCNGALLAATFVTVLLLPRRRDVVRRPAVAG